MLKLTLLYVLRCHVAKSHDLRKLLCVHCVRTVNLHNEDIIGATVNIPVHEADVHVFVGERRKCMCHLVWDFKWTE